jgi:hypothetical protein
VGLDRPKKSRFGGAFFEDRGLTPLELGYPEVAVATPSTGQILTGLTTFYILRKIDITNKEVPKSAFFVSLKGFLAGTWFLQKYNFLSTIFLV